MNITFRDNMTGKDRREIREILESTRVFYDFEIEVALEIVDDFLNKGSDSEYLFIVAEQQGRVAGYVNFGPSPCTLNSWDIYWIAVRKDIMNRGLGKTLLKMAEDIIRKKNGRNIWVETSSRKEYDATRIFYIKQGYEVVSELPDFYRIGDNKITFHKLIAENKFIISEKPGENIMLNPSES